ncbi:UPF0271 protein [Microbacterium sp. SORGH_AS 1204]|uniref:LamB/YcsF family protein n=1 Tax=Microbacterium sp. SORGH_AS_1204 TaxID=3041785 RepID=UPI00278E74B3|nr:5-oxoprolinase subunit PxpA [Microbacterium sp. SORGH_AS_1204]MDQ1136356.1 UPF0271 protein [Microbacterium sp. SORGH_AS_1204]
MTRTIDLIADVGEGYGPYELGDDAELLPLLTSANIACGFHAGDPAVMESTVSRCRDLGVAVGAHPGFDDRRGFGRRTIEMTADEVRQDVLYQLGAISAFARAEQVPLEHVTPHGRLGNLSMTDRTYATGIVDAVEKFDPTLPIVTPPGVIVDIARARGLTVARLVLADRAYEPDGTLVSRRRPGAVLHDPEQILDRLAQLVETDTITAVDGTVIPADADSILLHGDTPGAVSLALRIRDTLRASGARIAPLREVLNP